MIYQKFKNALLLTGVLIFSLLTLSGTAPLTLLKEPTLKIRVTVPVPPKFIPDKYISFLYRLCQDQDVPLLVVYALVNTESGWKQSARNYNKDRKGRVASVDIGRFQLNSTYLSWMIEKFGNPRHQYDVYNNAYDNAEIGIKYLSWLYKRFSDWRLAVMAYNCGPTAVQTGEIPDRTLVYGAEIVPVDGWWTEPENVELVMN